MLPMYQHSMFGCTLICETVEQAKESVVFKMRRAASDECWYVGVPEGSPMIERLARPGACFALVELASVAQAQSRERY